jgi:adenylosuccinate lyase
MLVKFAGLVEGLVVDGERMGANLEGTRGLIFSQPVLLALVEAGLTRDEAYRIVQRNAMAAWGGEGHLRDLLAADVEVSLSAETLDACFDLSRIHDSSKVVFERLDKLTLD